MWDGGEDIKPVCNRYKQPTNYKLFIIISCYHVLQRTKFQFYRNVTFQIFVIKNSDFFHFIFYLYGSDFSSE